MHPLARAHAVRRQLRNENALAPLPRLLGSREGGTARWVRGCAGVQAVGGGGQGGLYQPQPAPGTDHGMDGGGAD
eukprot:scaffold988_cov105-Isochrysis_galbana.AAC.11